MEISWTYNQGFRQENTVQNQWFLFYMHVLYVAYTSDGQNVFVSYNLEAHVPNGFVLPTIQPND